MKSRDLALKAAKFLDSKKACEITVIDISGKATFTDYLLIATGSSERHAEALSDALEEYMEGEGEELAGTEGRGGSGWILMDYSDFIVNIFTDAMREKYSIEKVWGDFPTINFEE
jgi:ribosome-associated protein